MMFKLSKYQIIGFLRTRTFIFKFYETLCLTNIQKSRHNVKVQKYFQIKHKHK